jgi:Zn-finger nucleic acid-binding protein
LLDQKKPEMNCPNCNETLVMAERQGVEIDYCPKCRGVWLDKGELDKIIERSEQRDLNAGISNTNDRDEKYRDEKYREDKYREDKYRDEEYKRKHGTYPHKKKRGFLGDFFDFD